MGTLRVFFAVLLLLIPGCTYLDDNPDNSEEVAEIETDPILGCTDSNAKNYDKNAEEDDGSCDYEDEKASGVRFARGKNKSKDF